MEWPMTCHWHCETFSDLLYGHTESPQWAHSYTGHTPYLPVLCLWSQPTMDQTYLKESQALVAHACNPSFLGGWDQEDCSSKPAWANSSQDPISKISRVKWTKGEAQVVECLLSKRKALSSSPNPTKKFVEKRLVSVLKVDRFFFLSLFP
jgi:hypothetical protein